MLALWHRRKRLVLRALVHGGSCAFRPPQSVYRAGLVFEPARASAHARNRAHEILLRLVGVAGVNRRPGQSAPPFELEAATVTISDDTVAVRYSRAGAEASVTYPVLRKYGETP